MRRVAASRGRQAIAVLLLMVSPVLADDRAPAASVPSLRLRPQTGDCVIFREGGAGWLLKSPTYWLKASIAGLSPQRRMANPCPRIGRQVSAYTPADQLRLAAATPCVATEAEAGEVDVLRVQVVVESWETPWSYQHGTVGWLFRGHFLDQRLHKGAVIDMDATWLEPCEAGS